MTRYFYFKLAFLSITAGLTVGMIVYGLFDINLTNKSEITRLLLKSITCGIAVGLIMGFLNMFLKIGNSKESAK
jgi:xanthosine utilization system XapX-like protein